MITKLNFTDRTIKSYAIRKLTPKECFRLMGVRDKVICTMQSSNAQAAERLPDWKGKGKPEDMAVSASQQYKQAGNSIVVDVLAHIYEQLFYPTPKSRKLKQLSLFADLDDALPDLPPTSANAAEEKIFLTTFSGYDSQLMAADVLREWHPDFRWTCKGWSDIVTMNVKYKDGSTLTHVLIFREVTSTAYPQLRTYFRLCKNSGILTYYSLFDLSGADAEEESIELRYATPTEEKLLYHALERNGKRWVKEKLCYESLDSEDASLELLREDFNALQKEYNRLTEYCIKQEQERDEALKKAE